MAIYTDNLRTLVQWWYNNNSESTVAETKRGLNALTIEKIREITGDETEDETILSELQDLSEDDIERANNDDEVTDPSDPYPGTTEISRGVFMDSAEETDEPAVYIRDDQGEVVMWTYSEVQDDHSAWIASMNAVAVAVKQGPEAVRKMLGR